MGWFSRMPYRTGQLGSIFGGGGPMPQPAPQPLMGHAPSLPMSNGAMPSTDGMMAGPSSGARGHDMAGAIGPVTNQPDWKSITGMGMAAMQQAQAPELRAPPLQFLDPYRFRRGGF